VDWCGLLLMGTDKHIERRIEESREFMRREMIEVCRRYEATVGRREW